MLERTKRQVHKWKFLQHALPRYVFNRSLFDIFTQLKWPKNKSVYDLMMKMMKMMMMMMMMMHQKNKSGD